MEIIDKTKDKKEEQWHLGDVISDGEHYGLIVKDYMKDYTVMTLGLEDDKSYDANRRFSSISLFELQDFFPTGTK